MVSPAPYITELPTSVRHCKSPKDQALRLKVKIQNAKGSVCAAALHVGAAVHASTAHFKILKIFHHGASNMRTNRHQLSSGHLVLIERSKSSHGVVFLEHCLRKGQVEKDAKVLCAARGA